MAKHVVVKKNTQCTCVSLISRSVLRLRGNFLFGDFLFRKNEEATMMDKKPPIFRLKI